MLFSCSYLQLCTGWINELIYYIYMSIYGWCHYYVTVILINSLAEHLWFLCRTLNVKLTFFVASFVSIKVPIYRKKKLGTIIIRDLLHVVNESSAKLHPVKFYTGLDSFFLCELASRTCDQMQTKKYMSHSCICVCLFNSIILKSTLQKSTFYRGTEEERVWGGQLHHC